MLCPENLAATVTALSINIAQGKSVDELAVIASIFSQVGDTLETIAAQRNLNQAICQKCCGRSQAEGGNLPETTSST
ncbi:MAG: DUF6774 domain-containing protein [Oscillospiraceae bacterium]